MSDATPDPTPTATPATTPAATPDATPPGEPAPLLTLRDGLTAVVASEEALVSASAALAEGSGPVAVDAERASGYRYSARAYLVQLRREGVGTILVDPVDITTFSALAQALDGPEWILHAASQDLPCLLELGLRPARLFDSELAGRLLGYPRVGLATLVEQILGSRMRKEHSAVDWSTRPLPTPWLEYAALDVEVLIELREVLHTELVEAGKWEWARQEFEHLRTAPAGPPRQEPWRRTSGLHRVRGRRSLAAVRALWEARDAIASQRDITPTRLIPDAAIIEAASALPGDRAALLAVPGFHGRGAQRYVGTWVEALRDARRLPESELPSAAARYDGPPPPRTWPERDPAAAARLAHARAGLAELAESVTVPVENLLLPDAVRRVLWDPPAPGPDGTLPAVERALAELGARPWQVELTAPVLAAAIDPAASPAASPAPGSGQDPS